MDFDMGEAGKYQMWTVNGDMIGGVTKLTPEMGPNTPPNWMASVSVADVDATARLAESLGGQVIMQPAEIPDVGRYAVISDPQGAVIALYKSNQGGPQGEFKPQVGQFSWHELTTSDYKAALTFYSRLFGWDVLSEMDMGEKLGIYAIFGHKIPGSAPDGNAPPYGGMFNFTPEMGTAMPPVWVYYIRVKSVDESVTLIPSLGGKIMNGPMEVPGGDRIAQCMDPQGAMFAIHSTRA
jgi:uncharacterized protein